MSSGRSRDGSRRAPAHLTRRRALGGAISVAALLASGPRDAAAQGVHGFRKRVEDYRERKHDEPSRSWVRNILPGHQPDAAASSQTPELLQAATGCISFGDACREYCQKRVKDGDAGLRACLEATQAMLPVCGALAKLSELNAARLKDAARASIGFLEDCRAECLKHAGSDAVFRDCASSCETCAQHCRKLLSA